MQTKNLLLWALYDLANSFVFIAFFLYYSVFMMSDLRVTDSLFNLCIVASTIPLLVVAPFVGKLLDTRVRNITGLRITSVAIALCYLVASWGALTGNTPLSLAGFTLGQFVFALSFVFYTPLLATLAPSKQRGLVSSLGISANFLGNMLALAVCSYISAGNISFFGGDHRAETLVPAVCLFVLFALPMLLFFTEQPHAQPEPTRSRTQTTFFNVKEKLFKFTYIKVFLVAFIFWNGAVVVSINNMPIILEQMWHVTDHIKSLILLGCMTTSVLGALCAGYVADRFGHERALLGVLFAWVLVFTGLACASNITWYVVLVLVGGLLPGASLTLARVVMVQHAHETQRNASFSYFTIAERASPFVGGMAWAATMTLCGGDVSTHYQAAYMVTALLVAAGTTLFVKSIRSL